MTKAYNVRGSVYEAKFVPARNPNSPWVTEYTSVQLSPDGTVRQLCTGGLGKNPKLNTHKKLLQATHTPNNEHLRGAAELFRLGR